MLNIAVIEKEIVALVGEARLFKLPGGKFELVGGSQAERAEIEKWAYGVLNDSPERDLIPSNASSLWQFG